MLSWISQCPIWIGNTNKEQIKEVKQIEQPKKPENEEK